MVKKPVSVRRSRQRFVDMRYEVLDMRYEVLDMVVGCRLLVVG